MTNHNIRTYEGYSFYFKNICLDPIPRNFKEIALDEIIVEIPQVIPAPKELKTWIDLKEILKQLPEQRKNLVENPNHRHQIKDKSRKKNSRKDQQSDSTTVRQSDYQ